LRLQVLRKRDPALGRLLVTPTSLQRRKRTKREPQAAMKAMLKGLLGADEFEKLCVGLRVGDVEDNVLQIFAPTPESAADIKLYLEEFAVAAEYGFMLPVRMVNVMPADEVL
jgi:hypothetical protein